MCIRDSRLIEVEKNSTTLGEYVYDGGGRRIQVTENSLTTTYIYAGMNTLYEENSTGTADYIYGPRGTLAKRTTINEESSTFYYHTDHLGSTRLVTDDNRNIVSAVTYDPFGETCTEEGSENHLFNGKEKDATNLYYYGARYYDPDLGRFITRDPSGGDILMPQSLNRYTYCLNNPLNYVDPAGLHASAQDAWADYRDQLAKQEKKERSTTRAKFGGFREYKTWGGPGMAIWWYGDIYIILLSPVFLNDDQTMGVAVACTARRVQTSLVPEAWHTLDFGIAIFFFDKDGNITEIVFIPFRELENDMEGTWEKIKTLLERHGISVSDFYYALNGCFDFLWELLNTLHELGVLPIFGGGGIVIILGHTSLIGWIAGIVVGVLLAFVIWIAEDQWGHWTDLVKKLQDLADRDREK